MVSSSSSSVIASGSQSRWKYDVFLSFRGEDTRDNFVSHLYTALDQKGIHTFIDNEELEGGKKISLQLPKAIRESRFSIVVLSKTYASSRWCLDELVEILECSSSNTTTVYPIFYHVDPSEVRNQTGTFGEEFAKSVSKQRVLGMEEKVQKWSKALEQVGNLSGWPYPSQTIIRSESVFIQEFVRKLFKRLSPTYSNVFEDLVGMKSCMKKVKELLGLGMDDARVVGIWGMGGIGKTTIAKAIYACISCQFEGCCFIENVREVSKNSGLKTLREQLISQILMEKDLQVENEVSALTTIKNMVCHKKVLIVLDDVEESTELENLIGKLHWFGFGSRIIITTRNQHMLNKYGITHIYEVEALREDEAIELFKLKAFRKHQEMGGYRELVLSAVNYAKGVPLALEVLGSALCGRNKDVWESYLNILKESPPEPIQQILKISFDGLTLKEKKIFLDIACFFKGEDKNDVTKLLESCGFHPTFGIDVLVKRSLITISNNKLMMHDLIQELGWYIVHQESPEEPGERSRLWLHEDMTHVLMKNTGTEKVEGIFVQYPNPRDQDLMDFEVNQLKLRPEAFAKMSNLRILKICCMHLSKDLKYLSNKLRYLDWCGYPMKYMPSTFQPKHLVELHLTYSRIEQLWEGSMHLDTLKIMDLSYSRCLVKSPDFTRVSNLERLILEGCTGLVNLHPSIVILKSLIFLNLKDCKNLNSLPRGIQLESLEVLNISGCSKLKNISVNFGYMKCLSELYLDGIGASELPPSVGHLTNLVLMSLSNCKNLKSIPDSICQLKALISLNLSGCSKLDKLPQDVGDLDCLEKLYLDGIGVSKLPPSVGHLTNLVLMSLSNCKNLRSIPDNICQLKALRSLNFSGCSKLDKLPQDLGDLDCLEELWANWTAIRQLPSSIGLLKKLEKLSLEGCKGIASNSWNSFFLPSILQRQRENYMTLELQALLGLKSLTRLNLRYCNLKSIPTTICHIYSLIGLDLSGNNFESLPGSLNQLSNLERLHLNGCKRLQELPELQSNISVVEANDCTSLRTISSPFIYENFFWFSFLNCFKLVENKQNNILTEKKILVPQYQALSLSPRYQRNSGQRSNAFIAFPGSEIPKWYQSRGGSSASFELPPHWHNRLLGISFALVRTKNNCEIWNSCDIHLSFKRLGTQKIIRKCGRITLAGFDSVYSRNMELMFVSRAHLPRLMKDEQLNGGGIEFQVCVTRDGEDEMEDVELGVSLVYHETDFDDFTFEEGELKGVYLNWWKIADWSRIF